MRQTDLRQTGVAVVEISGEERKVPLFSTDILLESYKLVTDNIVDKVKAVYPFKIEKSDGFNRETMEQVRKGTPVTLFMPSIFGK